VDAAGAPLSGATIRHGYSRAIATSDAEGRFRIEVPSDPRGVICARKDGLAPASIKIEEMPPEDRERIEFVLGPGHFVAGIVVGGDGTPVEGACVAVETSMQYPGCTFEGQTDPDGCFRIRGLPPDLGKATAWKEDRGSGVSPAKPDAEDVRIVLVLEEPTQITGIVVEQGTGNPVRRFHVFCGPFEPDMHHRFDPTNIHGFDILGLTRFDTTGIEYGREDGRFVIRGWYGVTRHALIVTAEGHVPQVAEGVEARPASMPGDPVRIEMVPGLTLRGRVIVQGTGEGVEGVRVIHFLAPRGSGISRESPARRTTGTDADGGFVLRDLTDIPGYLRLEKPGFAEAVYSGVAPSSEEQVFRLSPGAKVEGTVTGADGDPISAAVVAVAVARESFTASTDLQGHYRINNLPPGDATVTLQGTPGRRGGWTRRATLAAGETTIVDLSTGPCAIAGRVVFGREPVPKAWVRIRAEDYAHELIAGPDGGFRLEDLAPGEYRIIARRTGQDDHEARTVLTLRVDAGEVACDIALPDAILSGTVIDAVTRRPVERAIVQAHRQEDGALEAGATTGWRGGLGAALSDAIGRFEIGELMDGIYKLTARGPDGTDGFLGPLHVSPSARLTDLVIPLGGIGGTIRVLDARTRNPIPGARLHLELEDGSWSGREVRTDEAGAAIYRIGSGQYLLKASAAGYLPVRVSVNIEADAAPIEVVMGPAGRMVVILESRGDLELDHSVTARIVGGDEPGWLSDEERHGIGRASKDWPTGGRDRALFEIRPGRYRVSFRVGKHDLKVGLLEDVLERDLDVIVPEDGEAVVRLTLPAR